MDLRQLEYFVSVAATQHMSKSAEELDISQPALSAGIRKLEAELGTQLFDRRGRRLELNEYGAWLLQELGPQLERLRATFRGLEEMKFARRNEVTIDAEPIYTFPGLLERIYSTAEAYPGLTIKNVRYPFGEVIRKIVGDEIDFAVMGFDIDDARLEKRLLSRDELVMLVHSSHPMAGRESAPLSAFSRDLFAGKEKEGLPACYEQFSDLHCRRAGFVPRVAFKSPSRRELVDSVRSRHYVMFTPVNAIMQYRLDDLNIVHISDADCCACLWMYWKRGSAERAPARAVRETVLRFYEERSV